MHTFAIPRRSDGAVLPIEIGLNAKTVQRLRQASSPIPPPFSAAALLDSGAEASCIDRALAMRLQALGLQPDRTVFANFPALGGLRPIYEYLVNLTVLHPSGDPRANLVLRNLRMIEQALGPLGYEALIGRDVLDRCLLVYDGPGRRVTLAF